MVPWCHGTMVPWCRGTITNRRRRIWLSRVEENRYRDTEIAARPREKLYNWIINYLFLNIIDGLWVMVRLNGRPCRSWRRTCHPRPVMARCYETDRLASEDQAGASKEREVTITRRKHQYWIVFVLCKIDDLSLIMQLAPFMEHN